MSVSESIAHASNRFLDAIRSARADEAGDGELANDLAALEGHKYCLLTTYRRDGQAVPTPLWFGLADGRAYFRTYADAVKIKRIRNNPEVLIGPCDPRGKPKGPMTRGTARVVSEQEKPQAEEIVQSNYGLIRRMYKSGYSGRVEDVYVEVTPQ
jgi:PPOX class probable F420-dependent enzyme